ncbi:EscE/YscE/SsaE family type III secretion system needle protein co-chaperone [Clostridium manihotivorum]|jgi:hypothetical protein|nr:EscE/YscE/SsaE family type III secretion system needle protein co-chaperone [Clostridium manihotivorum]
MANARQNVQTTFDELNHCKQHLQDALNTVEKDQNRQKIQRSLDAVNNAINVTQDTISTYTES